MLKDQIVSWLSEKLGTGHFHLLTPKNPDHGDYAVYVNQIKSEKLKIKSFANSEIFDKIEEKAGFINFFVGNHLLISEVNRILEEKDNYGRIDLLKTKKLMVEFAHPNTHKLFHIGHLRNILLGEALSRIFTAASAEVIRTNYQGDVGLHIAKCLWAVMRRETKGERPEKTETRIRFLGEAYAEGNQAYEADEQAKKAIHQLNRQIFAKDPAIKALWTKTRQWSLDYFDGIYRHLGVRFDRLYFESEVAGEGLRLAQAAVQKGVLEASDGAIIFHGEAHGVDTRVFVNSQGLPTYEAKELGLAQLEFTEFGPLDRCIHVVGREQTSFFKTVFKVEELLDPALYQNKQFHFVYGFVRLKDGKMSSREGTVIEADQLIAQVKEKVRQTFPCDESTAESLTSAAVKYGFLKIDPRKDLVFDIDESISLQGNSGAYLLYTYARMKSLLTKGKTISNFKFQILNLKPTTGEKVLLRVLFRFPEVVAAAVSQYAPHLLAAYAFELTQKFNLFYEKWPILQAEADQRELRLRLTAAANQILKNVLTLLAIDTVDKL